MKQTLVDILIALAFVFACSASWGAGPVDKTVDPYTARLEWGDGYAEYVNVQNRPYCLSIEDDIRSARWRPVGRAGIPLVRVTCTRGGPIPGGSCIEGYVGPRAEGYCGS